MIQEKRLQLTPDPKVLRSMTGVYTGPYRYGDENDIYVVDPSRGGGGVIGITDLKSNRRWSGWFEHFITNARVGTFLAQKLKVAGIVIDPQLVLDGILAVHVGRRIYEEVKAYQNLDLVSNSDAIIKAGADATDLGRRILEAHNVRPEVIEFARVNATDADEVLDDIKLLEHRMGLYADYRVTTRVVSLRDRFNNLLVAQRVTPQRADELQAWTLKVEQEIFRPLDISPHDVTNSFPRQPSWERRLRRAYIEDVGVQAHDRIVEIGCNQILLDEEFDQKTWWGRTTRRLFDQGKLGNQTGGFSGTSGAIAYFNRQH